MEQLIGRRVLWKWDNTIWILVDVDKNGRYTIDNPDSREIVKVDADEVILINTRK